MPRTKKVGIVGNLGPRYGVKIKRKVRDVKTQNEWKCPDCLKNTINREAAGIWSCSKCGLKFAGKAYRPQ